MEKKLWWSGVRSWRKDSLAKNNKLLHEYTFNFPTLIQYYIFSPFFSFYHIHHITICIYISFWKILREIIFLRPLFDSFISVILTLDSYSLSFHFSFSTVFDKKTKEWSYHHSYLKWMFKHHYSIANGCI